MKRSERGGEQVGGTKQLQAGGVVVRTEEGRIIYRRQEKVDVDLTWARELKASFWHDVATTSTAGTNSHELASKAHEALETLFRDTLPPIFESAEKDGTSVNVVQVSAAWSTFVNVQNRDFFAKALDRALLAFEKALDEKDPQTGKMLLPEMDNALAKKAEKFVTQEQKLDILLEVWIEFIDSQKQDVGLVQSVVDPVRNAIDVLLLEFRAIQTMRCELSWAKLCLNIALELFQFPNGGTGDIVAECQARASLLRALQTMPSANKFFLKYCWWPEERDRIDIILGQAMVLKGYLRVTGTDLAAGHKFAAELARDTPVFVSDPLATFETLAGIRQGIIPSMIEAEAGKRPAAKKKVSSEELERAIAEVIDKMIEEQQQEPEAAPPPTQPVASDIDVY